MTRRLRRALLAAVIGAAVGPACLLMLYGSYSRLAVEFDVTPPRQLTGVYEAERDDHSGLTFAWTSDVLALRLPGLDRRVVWTLALRARSARAETPELTFYADGAKLAAVPSSSDFSVVRVEIPSRPERRGLALTVESTSTVVPGPHDPRKLGVMLDRLELSTAGFARPPQPALAAAAIWTAAAAGVLAFAGAGSILIATVTLFFGLCAAALLARGFAPYGGYPETLGTLSAVAWLACLLTCVVARLVLQRPQRVDPWFPNLVIVASTGFVVLKLSILLHPNMPVGDAMFHAHRFHDVLGGRFYFTSIAPGNYSFPYPPGLYVFAMPFADLVRRGPADMTLLRTIVIAIDALAAAVLAWGLVRGGASRVAAACALLLYHVVPLDYRIATVGNLTNAFAQSLAVFAFAAMVGPFARRRRVELLLITTALLAAFLSHTGTFAIGAASSGLIGLAIYWRGGVPERSTAHVIMASTVAAVLLAVALYYAHFGETYRAEWTRISSETATAAPDAGGRGIGARASAVPRSFYLYLGLPATMLAAWGLGQLRRNYPPRLVFTIAGWIAACGLFLVLGIVTPVDMRQYLAVIPAVAALGGLALEDGWNRPGMPRVMVTGLAAWAGAIFLHTWWSTLSG
jgi:hypothetical protein